MKNRLLPQLLFALVGLIAAPAYAYKVISIADGDTLTVLVERRPIKIRLAGIDAPEKNQAFGSRSQQSLSELCFNKEADYRKIDEDQYGRIVAMVRCDGVDANRAQVERGMAWVYLRFSRDPKMLALQDAAKAARRGLWADKDPTPPWQFRQQNR